MENMLKNLVAMIQNPRVKDALELIEQLLINLLGKKRLEWKEQLKKFLRKGLIIIRHDMLFDPNENGEILKKPKIWTLEKTLGPAEIQRELTKRNLRMGTVVEAISYMGLKTNGKLKIIVFTSFSPNQYPCAVFFFKDENVFQMSIMRNSDTAVWQPGCNILVFPA